MNRLVLYGILVSIGLSSCDKDLMVDSSPKGDFNLFFEYLENDYSYRDYHPFTMAELKQKYLPQIENSNTETTLANILLDIMLNELKDPHVYMNSDEPYYISGVGENNPTNKEELPPLFQEINIERTPFYTFGVVQSHPNIGYIYIERFNYDIGGTSSLHIEDGVKDIDGIIQGLIDKGVTSMIVDIRSYAGGSNYVPRYIAQRFIDKTAIYMVEYYPEGKTFIRKEWKVKPEGTGFRTGKIALLSNGLTASGGEMFLLAMLQRDNLVHIGSNSGGASGNIVDKDLSNGWNFRITQSRTEYPDGKQYFKVGIIPSIIVRNIPSYDVLDREDKVITRAIDELQR